MALIKCVDCGNDVSDQAEKCLHCGRLEESHIKTKGMMKGVIKVVGVFMTIFTVFMSFAAFSFTLAAGTPIIGILGLIGIFFVLRFFWKFINNL